MRPPASPASIAFVAALAVALLAGAACGRPDSSDCVTPANRLVYVSQRNGLQSLYVMNADGSGARRLTTSTSNDTQPRWSPDGTRVAFARAAPSPATSSQIYVIQSDGSGETQVTHTTEQDVAPAWSPDGTQLVFARLTAGTNPFLLSALYTIHVDGTAETMLNVGLLTTQFSFADTYGPGYPDWRGTGGEIGFSFWDRPYRYGAGDLYSVHTDGTTLVNITNGPQEPSDRYYVMRWSPDGARIVFAKYDEESVLASSAMANTDIYVIGADGSGLAALDFISDTVNNNNPAWNGDASCVVFDSDRDGASQLHVLSVARDHATDVRITSDSFDNSQADVAWH